MTFLSPEHHMLYVSVCLMSAGQLATAGLRVRAYKCTRSRRDQLLGECSIAFLVLDLASPCIVMAHLEARSSVRSFPVALILNLQIECTRF